ncbi:GNAT family N-acetyltransferase [Verrucomicrobiota bacterium]
MNGTTLRKVTHDDAAQLAAMLRADTQLRGDLSIPNDARPTVADVLTKVQSWETKTNGETYTIVADVGPIGIISVHPSSEDSTLGKVGYWVGSKYRDRGYCTDALRQLAAVAANHHMTSVSGAVTDTNIASCRVWQKLNAHSETIEEGKQRFTLPVDRQQ